jgi:hypothetical protein
MAKQFPARGEQFFHGEARVKQLEQANRARVAAEQAKAQQAAKDALGRLGSEGMSTPIGNGPKFGGGI